MFKKRLKNNILKAYEHSYNLKKTKENLLFEEFEYPEKKKINLRIVTISILILGLFLIVSIFISNFSPSLNSEESLWTYIPSMNLVHIKIVEVDPKEYYYKYEINDDKTVNIPYVILEAELLEFFNSKVAETSSYKDVETISMAIPLDYYNIFFDYNEFIIDTNRYTSVYHKRIYISESKYYSDYTDLFIYYYDFESKYNENILPMMPIKNNMLNLQEFKDMGYEFSTYPEFNDFNSFYKDSPYQFKDRMTIVELRSFFAFVSEEANNYKKRGCY